ncbi:MAG: formylglycine-generating enzyme family protein [Akkermansiaceae bacterium]
MTRYLILYSLLFGFFCEASPTENSLGMKMVKIEKGTFLMGSPESEKGHQSDEKQRKVSISKTFFMSATEVTQKQWIDLMETTFEDLINQQRGPAGRGAKLSSKVSAIGDQQPMCYVNWADAMAFCKKLTEKEHESGALPKDMKYSLPTEAQWEYACRGGTSSVFSNGNVLTSEMANFYGKMPYGTKELGEYREKTTKVASFSPNAWGLFDMHGNVYEWCSDWYEESPTSTADPIGPEEGDGRVIRGGAWDRKASSCRSAYRYSRDPNRRAHNIGFRIVVVPSDS